MTETSDWLDKIKLNVKKYPKLYRIIIDVISPVYQKKSYIMIEKYVDIENSIILNIGSGPFKLNENILNVDITSYENVDIIADGFNLPFKSNSVDAILNIVILEHVPNPECVINEIHRVLKNGGVVYTVVPFIQGYHASPYDYKRWTSSGVLNLHSNFTLIESGVGGGPTSGFIWILTEWLALLFSFRIMSLYKILFVFFTLILWPFKFIDVFLIDHPMAKNIASNFYYLGMKK
jgi:SAM-dependent methyltransferase